MSYKHIEMKLIGKTPKTNIWAVSAKHGDQIGVISWYARWRQYCYFPAEDTVYSKGCLEDINAFIDGMKREQKQGMHGG